MSQADSTTKIDAYLDLIEARERKNRNKRLRLLGLLFGVLFLGGAFAAYQFLWAKKMEQYNLKEIDYTRAEAILSESPEGFVITYPEMGMVDTIRTLQNFANFQSIVESLSNPDLMSSMVSDVEGDGTSGVSQGLPMFVVDVSGTREAGQKLTFTVENYDESVSYLIDFGNGIRRTMRERLSYTYPRSGRFTMKLLASAADRGNSVYAKEFRIAPKRAESAPQTTLAANIQEGPAEPEAVLDTVANPDETAASRDLDISDLNAEESETEAIEDVPTTLLASASEDVIPAEVEPVTAAEATPTPAIPAPAPARMAPLVASEVMPEYPGGTRALARFFRRNATYPREARNNNVEGVVYVRFVVNADGSLSNPIVIKGLGYGCDEEALRLVRNMPAWVPGEQDGTAVPVYQSVPVTFKLVN